MTPAFDGIVDGPNAGETILMTLAMADATGAARMALQFASALRNAGFRVICACGPAPESGAETHSILPALRANGIEVWEMPGLQRPGLRLVRSLTRRGRKADVRGVIGVMQRDRVVALAVARALGVPCVIAAQNQHRFWGMLPIRRAKEWLYRRMIQRHADLVVCTSHVVQDEIQTRFGVPASRTVVLPNGIDTGAYKAEAGPERARIRQEFGVYDSDILLVNVGRLDIQKGQDVLLEAFAPLARSRPDIKLVFVGDVTFGSNHERMLQYAESLRAFVDGHGLSNQVIFAGWRSDIKDVLSAGDAYVHSARWEGPALCLAIMEAMAAGLPVVATDCSGRPDGFEDGREGYIVITGSAASLAEGLKKLSELTAAERVEMGEHARAYIESYDISVIGRRFVDLIRARVPMTERGE